MVKQVNINYVAFSCNNSTLSVSLLRYTCYDPSTSQSMNSFIVFIDTKHTTYTFYLVLNTRDKSFYHIFLIPFHFKKALTTMWILAWPYETSKVASPVVIITKNMQNDYFWHPWANLWMDLFSKIDKYAVILNLSSWQWDPTLLSTSHNLIYIDRNDCPLDQMCLLLCPASPERLFAQLKTQISISMISKLPPTRPYTFFIHIQIHPATKWTNTLLTIIN